MNRFWITGLVPATFTPMHADGSLNLAQVGPVVDHLVRNGVGGLYVCGSTGEGVSLSREERMATVEAHVEAAAGRIPVIVQVGHNSLAESRQLAAHAQACGADAISSTPPFYFKPRSLDILVDCLAEVMAGAPDLPFYYYHIPVMTGVPVDVVDLLRVGQERLPTMVGVKFSAPTVFELQAAVNLNDGQFNLLFGSDEMMLSGLVAGAHGAVGSTYNFAAPLFNRVIAAFEKEEMGAAMGYQAQAVEMIRIVARYGGNVALKPMMKLIGLDCGPTRLPLANFTPAQMESFQQEMTDIGFFEWVK